MNYLLGDCLSITQPTEVFNGDFATLGNSAIVVGRGFSCCHHTFQPKEPTLSQG